MKTNIYVFSLFTLFLFLSCEKDIDNENSCFSIEFSDGTVIKGNNILFYDSSTCVLFLKEKVNLNVDTGDSVNPVMEFNLYVNEEKIYGGIIWPVIFNKIPDLPYISCRSYPYFESDFMEIKHYKDSANDYRIIECLEKNNLLKHGITCKIDTVYVNSYSDSSVTCVLTLENLDDINYYVPDPRKMGVSRFNCYTGGLGLSDKTRDVHYSANYSTSQGCNELSLDDLSVLKGNSKISFTYTSSYRTKFDKGTFSVKLRYESMGFFKPVTLNLNQDDGRIWIGQIFVEKENIVFN
ncbi:MAG: hypothetical protein K9H26_18845 [Prolixibacteraceae bacterium]|nr:hypothetical protein [Prolixibacteraceae bacterium]